MSLRISSIFALLLLTACDARDEPTAVNRNADAGDVRLDDRRVLCAHHDAPFKRDCSVEQINSADGVILTVRHPDGGFRRLLLTYNGRGVVAADGASAARITIVGHDEVEVAIDGDRYRLPATIAGRAS